MATRLNVNQQFCLRIEYSNILQLITPSFRFYTTGKLHFQLNYNTTQPPKIGTVLEIINLYPEKVHVMRAIQDSRISRVASDLRKDQSIQKEHYDKNLEQQQFNIENKVLSSAQNLIRENIKRRHFTKHRTGLTNCRSLWQNIYRLSSNNKVLKINVYATKLKRYFEQPPA